MDTLKMSPREHKAKLETARLMLANNMPAADISKYTGLSLSEIQQISSVLK